MIELENFAVGEGCEAQEVHQRCILVSSKCNTAPACERDDGYVVVQVTDDAGQPLFPEQRWPIRRGYFKALVLLSPGRNNITITPDQDGACRAQVPTMPAPLVRGLMLTQ